MADIEAMDLELWQQRLAQHFDALVRTRSNLPQKPATFALEHGLSEDQRRKLAKSVCNAVNQSIFSLAHFLPWVVYASEIGYLFAGGEYWQTFEQKIPGWSQRGDRRFIKSCFERFANCYNGAVPSGPWARHFSIICWPITHAILPKDLQKQLAKILYEIRHKIVDEHIETPTQLGKLVAVYGKNASPRFRQLSQETGLMGQISAALLLHATSTSVDFLEQRTLNRIKTDLDLEHQARSWLAEASSQYRRSTTLSGLRRSGRGHRAQTPVSSPKSPRPGLRPRMHLRPSDNEVWAVFMNIPDLSTLVRVYPELHDLVSTSRIFVSGYDRPLASGALLHGSRLVALKSWPTTGTPLLRFEHSHPELDALLDHYCYLDTGPWLFRVGADGIAWEIQSRSVSANVEYLLLANDGALETAQLGRPVPMNCANLTARMFSVQSFDDEVDTFLSLGLQPARQVSVQPAGLAPAKWDGSGSAEWLSSDQPMIGLRSNYGVSHYDVTLDVGTEELQICLQPDTDTSACFVQFPPLRAGVYQMVVTAHPTNSAYAIEQGELEVTIRDPLPLGAHSRPRNALFVSIEPSEATLEDLWEGRATIQAFGPPSRDIKCHISLFVKRRVKSAYEVTIPIATLPMSPMAWSSSFERFCRRKPSFENAYLGASYCELIFDGGDLGFYRFTFEREFTPLRWGVSRTHDGYAITLFDDVESQSAIDVYRYDFSSPDRKRRLNTSQLTKAKSGQVIPGLYVARAGEHLAVIVVPPGSLEGLKEVSPRFQQRDHTPQEVKSLLDLIDIWGSANLAGNIFARVVWKRVLRDLVQQIAGLMGGTPWYKAELAFSRKRDQRTLENLAHEIPSLHQGQGWDDALLADLDLLSESNIDVRLDKFVAITGDTMEICDFALRLASDPVGLQKRSGERFNILLNDLRYRTTIARAARFLVVAISDRLQAALTEDKLLYVGWRWN